MEDRNPVLGFSWENDIQNNLPDRFVAHSEETEILFRAPQNPMIASSLFVQADPKDIFEFYNAIAGKRKYRVTKELWRYTIDTYLFHYCLGLIRNYINPYIGDCWVRSISVKDMDRYYSMLLEEPAVVQIGRMNIERMI